MLRRAGLCAIVTLAVLGLALPASAVDEQPAPTVVSFTFDDGWASQYTAAEVLAEHGMAGTFYISSGSIEKPGYLTLPELQHLGSTGHEIAGHTLTHPRLTDLPIAEVTSEVCGDRAVLARLGFTVTDFAYPYGAFDNATARVVRECGYNSARRTSGLNEGDQTCTLCPITQQIPLESGRWVVRTPEAIGSLHSLEHLKSLVLRAEAEGGWLPLVFHKLCRTDCDDISFPLSQFTEFVSWIESRPASTSVRTVQQVVGGEVRPSAGEPPAEYAGLPPFGSGADASEQASLSDAAAFTLMGYGIGQLQVIIAGILIAAAAIGFYRFSTRNQRNLRRKES